ncbi:MAG TPA: glycosyltransferase family 2 protein [Flavobacteriaceae bacterium]|nr:glycosyltransferase family 2 protein [Flavobacteriaceae bacterium]
MILKDLLPTYQPVETVSSFEYKFTVFTPVYNRADTLHRVFDSLNKQTFKNFELIIINDGSTDNSHDEITEHLKNVTFKATYVNNEENKHKMACLVQGISLAKGEFFLPFDSDDECTEDALQVFHDRYNTIPEHIKENVSSVTCLCKNQFGELVGEKFDTDPFYSSTFNNILINRYKLEKWGFTKTEILKGVNINPYLYSRGYIPEGVIWTLLSKLGFKTMYINEVLRIYYLDTGNSITGESYRRNTLGLAVYSLCILNWFYKDSFFKNPILFLKWVYYLLMASKNLEFSLKDIASSIDSYLLRSVFIICWPFRILIKFK